MGPFRVITKPGCPYCDKAKMLLKIKGHSFSEDLRNTPADIESFKAAGYRSFPQVFLGEKRIGGFDQLKSFLNGSDNDNDDF